MMRLAIALSSESKVAIYIGDNLPTISDVQGLADIFGWSREIAITKGPGDSGYYLLSSPYDEAGNAVINDQLQYPQTTDFGPRAGGFSVLNVPDDVAGAHEGNADHK